MIKEISYTGLTTTPDDYHAEAGTLSYAQDLISQHGSMVNPPIPERMFSIPTNSKLLYIHKQPNYTNRIYITTEKDTYTNRYRLFYTSTDDELRIRKYIQSLLDQNNIEQQLYNKANTEYKTTEKQYKSLQEQGASPAYLRHLNELLQTLYAEIKGYETSIRKREQLITAKMQELSSDEKDIFNNKTLIYVDEDPIQVTSIGTTLNIFTSTGIINAIFRDSIYYVLPESLPSLNPICALKGTYESSIADTPLHLGAKPTEIDYTVLVNTDYRRIVGKGTAAEQGWTEFAIYRKDTGTIEEGYYKLIIEPDLKREISMSVEINLVYRDPHNSAVVRQIPTEETTGTYKELYFVVPESTTSAQYFEIDVRAEFDHSAISDYTTFILLRSKIKPQYLISENEDFKSYTAIKAAISSFINKYSLDQKKFMHPFFVRLAYRMYDGRYVCHSAPCLMIPNTGAIPYVRPLPLWNKTDDIYSINFVTSAFIADLQLQININNDDKKWKDLITEVVIAITEPIYQYKDLNTTDELRNEMFITDYSDNNKYKSYGCITNVGASTIYGMYSNSSLESKASAAKMSDFSIKLPIKPSLSDLIEESSNFYIIKRIPFEDLCDNNSYNTLSTVDLSNESISNLSSHELLPDDTTSLNNYAPKSVFPYNSRLHIGNYKEYLFKGYPLSSANQYIHSSTSSDITEYIEIEIHELSNVYTVYQSSNSANNSDLLWYYYPHISAKKATIYRNINGSWSKITIQLKKHPFLNGSYWFNNYSPAEFKYCNEPNIISTKTYINKSNYLKVSEPNNPFYYTNLRTYIFDSDILAMSAAVTPLSTGQAGDFDLYVFTEQDGVWSLKINSEGGYSKQIPVTRDTLTNPSSVTQIDSSVLFATTRGLIELHGSQSTCISELLDREETISLNDMPLIGTAMLSHLLQMGFTITYASSDTSYRNPILSNIEALDFRTYLQDSQILYDYRNQRIIVFSPNTAYCYSYNIRSKTWTLLSNPYTYKINSYPDSLVVDSNNILLNVSGDSRLEHTEPQQGFLLTRPFDLDDPNNFKVIDQIRQNGTAEMVQSSHIQQVLWGSNDLITWHFISSSKTGRISGQSGTPYRFFRLAVATALTPLETLDSFSISYRTKENNDKLF